MVAQLSPLSFSSTFSFPQTGSVLLAQLCRPLLPSLPPSLLLFLNLTISFLPVASEGSGGLSCSPVWFSAVSSNTVSLAQLHKDIPQPCAPEQRTLVSIPTVLGAISLHLHFHFDVWLSGQAHGHQLLLMVPEGGVRHGREA